MKRRNQFLTLALLGFLLGVRDGHLALWEGDDPQPRHIFHVEVASLPPADRVALRRGIAVESQQELLELLQDYL